MSECNLKQADLSELLGVSLSRVKAMTSGRVKHLTREESEVLIRRLNIRADWLINGEGRMFDEPEIDPEFTAQMGAAMRTLELVKALPLTDVERWRLEALITGDAAADALLIANALRAQSLPPDEAALLDNYRHADEDGREAARRVLSSLAKQKRA
ncbi:hypothetical protein [Variovorax boronicumulans]|uniref:hypothetical protein n=1 Tax=Variovorax boronicumulans TaxID=436515 RepID=UPI001C57B9C0